MKKQTLITILEGWQSKDPYKHKINEITQAVIESSAIYPLLEASDLIKRPLGFPVAVFNTDLLGESDDNLITIAKMLGITETQIKKVINAEPNTEWKVANRKDDFIYANKKEFEEGGKSLSIWDETNKKYIDFKPPQLITKTYGITEIKKPIETDNGVYVPIGNKDLKNTVVYQLSKEKYIMVFQLKSDPSELYLFSIKPESFNVAFDIDAGNQAEKGEAETEKNKAGKTNTGKAKAGKAAITPTGAVSTDEKPKQTDKEEAVKVYLRLTANKTVNMKPLMGILNELSDEEKIKKLNDTEFQKKFMEEHPLPAPIKPSPAVDETKPAVDETKPAVDETKPAVTTDTYNYLSDSGKDEYDKLTENRTKNVKELDDALDKFDDEEKEKWLHSETFQTAFLDKPEALRSPEAPAAKPAPAKPASKAPAPAKPAAKAAAKAKTKAPAPAIA